ncbi:MAG: folate-binding protein YgfZ [Betaproteobacteria bacterium]|nr:folate-binding protein YgfZ [Betaproteobacteria bacterium]MDE2621967.1 folate-binding protein YgfZ [Betaproteobacteria bacterium]
MSELTVAPRWVDLSGRALIRATGDDAQTFLQGQLTQDVAALDPDRALWAAHCSPKGRMLASFLIWKQGTDFWLDAPEELADGALRRLRMYVLRSRVTLEDVRSAWSRFGICGMPEAGFWEALGCPPAPPAGRHDLQSGIMRVTLSSGRLMLAVPTAQADQWRTRISGLLPAGRPEDWVFSAVQDGVAEIRNATQDEWVPQMLNWDLIGGISFKKGCYTGQEIVARTHYLGKTKRRLLHFRTEGSAEIGQPLYGPDPSSPAGKVALAASTDRGTELLAVVHLEALAGEPLHLGEPGGAALEPLPLPYPVPLD